MRNGIKDEVRMTAIREQMLSEGFRLFAERGIESVNMKDVADACNVGIATLYRYFRVKLELVLAIGERKWIEYGEYVSVVRKVRNADAMTAAEELELYMDFYMDLYEHHKDLLRFNQDFNSYVQREGATREQLRPYLMAVSALGRPMHGVYEKALKDGTVRTDIPEEKMYATTAHIMLAVGVRYAQGLLYESESEVDRTEEYKLLKKMILREYVVEKIEKHRTDFF